MARSKKEGGFAFVFRHIKGEILLGNGFSVDDFGNPILKHRLYAYETNRALIKIYLNPKK